MFYEKSKDTEALFKAKSTKQGKKKNDKDKIVNILLKNVFTSLLSCLKKKGGYAPGTSSGIDKMRLTSVMLVFCLSLL